MKKVTVVLTLVGSILFVTSVAATPKSALLKAACNFEGSLGGAVVEKTILSTGAWGGTVYLYYVEGCGGGNHSEPHLSLVKGGRVIAHEELLAFNDRNELVPYKGVITEMKYSTKTNCPPGVIALKSRDYQWVYGYDAELKIIDDFGGECRFSD